MASRSDYDTLVITAPGLEAITRGELESLGVQPNAPSETGAIAARVPLQALHTLNLNLRTASRITVLAGRFHARAFGELERRARAVAWDEWFASGRAVRLRVTCRKSRLYHSDAVAERIAAAIVARSRADVHTVHSEDYGDEQLVLVRLLRDECTIRIDTSGAHLHRRGYRQAVAKAPLRETLAAAMLLATRWDPRAPLIDPFCGSGTIAIEAAMLARNIAPGGGRSFAFMRWPNFDRRAWSEQSERARVSQLGAAPAPILAWDRDAGAIEAARANAERAGVAKDVAFESRSLSSLNPPGKPGWLITNPPYGVRIGERAALRDLYAVFGRIVRERLGGWRVALLSAHPMLEAQLGFGIREIFRSSNGGVNVRLVERAAADAGT